jgi:uncharacterized membrane protein YebE (DUF533 family)
LLVGLSALSLVGCENLPGSKGTQGAVIGGASGATVGALVGGHEHRLVGTLLGGALGAAGGYVVGANSDRILGRDQSSAEEAARRSQEHPATAQDALRSTTADLNNDGFVTLDEVVAMRDAGLSDGQMLDRLRATNQVFELTPEQRQYLLDRGVSPFVVDQMQTINQDMRNRLLAYPQPTTPYPAAAPAPGGYYPGTVPPPVTAPPIVGQPPATLPPRY